VPGWLGRILVVLVLTQAAMFLARPVTSYRALALGADERLIGLITASFAVVPLLVAVPLGRAEPQPSAGSPVGLDQALCSIVALRRALAPSMWAAMAAMAAARSPRSIASKIGRWSS
jgi:hypothetical protein